MQAGRQPALALASLASGGTRVQEANVHTHTHTRSFICQPGGLSALDGHTPAGQDTSLSVCLASSSNYFCHKQARQQANEHTN